MSIIDSRFELKYRINFEQYLGIKSEILTCFRKDEYSAKASTGKYFVRSLYYDNAYYLCLRDKVEGEFNRVKLRLRCYSPEKDRNKFISVQIKRKLGEKIYKKSFGISMDEYVYYLHAGHFQSNDPLLVEFLRLKRKHCFMPIVVIEYFREGFEIKFGKKLRLTFDHGLKSYPFTQLFDVRLMNAFIKRNSILFEIKTEDMLPGWLMSLIKKYSCERVQNSKYALGVVLADAKWKSSNNNQLQPHSTLNEVSYV